MKRHFLVGAVLATLAIGLFWAHSHGQPKTNNEQKSPGIAASPIEAASNEYAAAFNRGDLAAVTAFWAEGADYISDDGTTTKGRAAIGELFKSVVKAEGGAKIALKTTNIRMVGDSIALHDGQVELTGPDGSTSQSMFTAVWTKVGGKWLLERARDIALLAEEVPQGPYERLKELEWLVGSWTAKEGTVEVAFQCRWSKSKAFLILEQQVKLSADEVLTVTKILGWDPMNEHIRSWMFDSTGGYGSGVWTREGNSWTVDVDGVTIEGKSASSSNLWKFVDDDVFEWSAVDRQIDGAPAADVRLKFTRVPTAK